MRAHVMRTGQLSLVIVVLSAIPAMWDSSSAAPPAEVPVKDVFLPSKRELFLPPYLETEDDLSMHAGYYGGGAPGRDPYSHFGMTKYLSMPNGVIFLSGEGFITQNARGGATALLHTRQLLGEGLLGTGISYSVHESMADGIFEQSAVHVEMFPSDEWSFRANAYVPTGNRSQQIFNSGPIPGLPGFAGNNIAVPTVTTTMSEAAMRGYELEAARKLGVWAAEVFGTYYRYFGRNGGPNTEGARVGLRGYVSRRLSANVNVSDDPLFGTNVFGGFTWNFGGGAALAPSNIRDKLTIPVERHRQIVLNNAANMIPGIVTVTNGGIPITVTHVQQGAGGANIGTFEDPFNTNGVLPTQPTQIVYVHSGGTYVNGYTLDTDQRALAEGGFSPHIINTDQFGPTFLPPGNGGFIRPTINGTITAANGSEISNFAMAPAGTSVSLPGLAGSVNVNRTTVTGGTTAVDVIGGSGTFTFTDVQIADPTTTGISIVGGSSTVIFGSTDFDSPVGLFGPSSITQSAAANTVIVSGGHTGTLLLNNGSTITATNGTGLQFDNADGIATYTFDGTVTLNGGDAGIDIMGGSDGAFTFADTTITSPTGTAVQIGTPGVAGSGGTANITFGPDSSIVQANMATAIGIFGDHSGTFTFDGPITATDGDGLQLGDTTGTSTDGTYNFNGTVTLNAGDAGIDILGPSTGTFMFPDMTITSPTGTGFNIDGSGSTSQASVNYTGGDIVQMNNSTTLNVLNHSTGMVVVDVDISATSGDGLQFSNADGTYDFNGTMLLDGGDAGIDVMGGSDGVFTFNRPTILNPSAGPAINIVGGTAQTTLEEFIIETTNTTGINVDSTGETTVLANADLTTTGARGLDINNTLVNMNLRNVIVENSTAEGIDIDGTAAGSSFTITGLTRIVNAAAEGIDLDNSEGTFTFSNVDIDGTAGRGIDLTGNAAVTSVTIDGGEIDDVMGGNDAIHIENTNATTVNNILFGFVTPISGHAINYVSNDAVARGVTLTNNNSFSAAAIVGSGITVTQGAAGQVDAVITGNSLATTGQTFITTDFGDASTPVVLQIDNNSWNTAAADFASSVTGSAMDSTIVTSLDGNSTSGGGMLFDQVTFDASGPSLAGFQTEALDTTLISATGDGLSFINPTGNLRFIELNITNFFGTGLEVFTKGLGTTFNLEVDTGSIDTFVGPALFLDPLSANIRLASAESSFSSPGGAPVGNFSSNGTGVFVDELTAIGGPAANALTIDIVNVSNSADHGIRIEDSDGQFTFGSVDIDTTGTDGISLNDNTDAATRVSINGGTIVGTTFDGVSANDTALTVSGVVFGTPTNPIGLAAIDIINEDDVVRTHFITNNNSGPSSILGGGIEIQTTAGSTGNVTAFVENNNLVSTASALFANTNGNPNANILAMSVDGNTLANLVATTPAVNVLGDNIDPTTNSLRVISLDGNTVNGNGLGSGVLFSNVTFDGGGQVNGGTTTIGNNAGGPANDDERVQGNGLALLGVSGDLAFTQLNIANNGGVGLLVDTKTDGTTFNLAIGGGTIDTNGGPAMFLDPLSGDMTFGTVLSSGSLAGVGISTGDGLAIEGFTGNLTIADLQVSDALNEGIQIEDSTGNIVFSTVAIATTGGDGVLIGSLGPNPAAVSILGGTIDATGDDGLDIRNAGTFTLNDTTFTNIGSTFTGTFTNNAQLNGSRNIDDNFQSFDGGGNNGFILFNDGVNQAP